MLHPESDFSLYHMTVTASAPNTQRAASLFAVEPDALLEHFRQHPPLGFETFLAEDGSCGFNAPFDLLTTADAGLLKTVNALPGGKLLRRLLTLDTCFFGSTVSEYCTLAAAGVGGQAVRSLLSAWGRRSMFMIVKDLPEQSPLLPPEANRYAETVVEACRQEGFIEVDGQALAYVPIDFASADEYLGRLSSGRRRSIRRKLRSRARLRVEILETGCERLADPAFLEELYARYLEVYAQSEIHFDLLSAEFFRSVFQDATLDGRLFLYFAEDALIGYNLCFIHDGMLIDKYIGFRYPVARDYNLYFVSWMENLEFARTRGLRYYVAGWTDPEVKAFLGAKFTFTRHLVFVRNPLLRLLMRKLSGLFESDRKWFDAKHHDDTADS